MKLGSLAFVLAALVFASGCRQSESSPSTTNASGESCEIRSDDGGVLEVRGRPDGIYAVRGDVVATAPLARIEHIVKTGEGVDPKNDKRWIGMHFSADDEARAVRDFTAESTPDKRIQKEDRFLQLFEPLTKIDQHGHELRQFLVCDLADAALVQVLVFVEPPLAALLTKRRYVDPKLRPWRVGEGITRDAPSTDGL